MAVRAAVSVRASIVPVGHGGCCAAVRCSVRQEQRSVDAAESLRVVRALAEWKRSRDGRQVLLLCGGLGCAMTSLFRVRTPSLVKRSSLASKWRAHVERGGVLLPCSASCFSFCRSGTATARRRQAALLPSAACPPSCRRRSPSSSTSCSSASRLLRLRCDTSSAPLRYDSVLFSHGGTCFACITCVACVGAALAVLVASLWLSVFVFCVILIYRVRWSGIL